MDSRRPGDGRAGTVTSTSRYSLSASNLPSVTPVRRNRDHRLRHAARPSATQSNKQRHDGRRSRSRNRMAARSDVQAKVLSRWRSTGEKPEMNRGRSRSISNAIAGARRKRRTTVRPAAMAPKTAVTTAPGNQTMHADRRQRGRKDPTPGILPDSAAARRRAQTRDRDRHLHERGVAPGGGDEDGLVGAGQPGEWHDRQGDRLPCPANRLHVPASRPSMT